MHDTMTKREKDIEKKKKTTTQIYQTRESDANTQKHCDPFKIKKK